MSRHLLILLIFLLASWPARAEDVQAEIRFRIASEDTAWVGQRQEVQLELWTNAQSFSGQSWNLPEVPGGFLVQAGSSALKLGENRGDSYWQGLRYSFDLYPQRPGEVVITPFEVRFSAREAYGQPDQPFAFTTPRLTLPVQMPPGADAGGLVVSSRDFSMQARWSPELAEDGVAELKVGDALTLEIHREASDVPGMVFAPIPEPQVEGLGIYAGNPRVKDRADRGDFTGSRTDTLTVVSERAGAYTLPELRFQWWDPQKEKLSEQVIPAVELHVAENPVWSGTAAGHDVATGSVLRLATWAAIGGLLLWGLQRYLGPPLRARYRGWRRQRQDSEPGAFRRVLRACAAADAPAAYQAVNEWILYLDANSRHSAPGGRTLSGLAAQSGDEALVSESTALQLAISSSKPELAGGRNTVSWNGKKMAAALKRLRSRWRDQEGAEAAALTQLNPRSFR